MLSSSGGSWKFFLGHPWPSMGKPPILMVGYVATGAFFQKDNWTNFFQKLMWCSHCIFSVPFGSTVLSISANPCDACTAMKLYMLSLCILSLYVHGAICYMLHYVPVCQSFFFQCHRSKTDISLKKFSLCNCDAVTSTAETSWREPNLNCDMRLCRLSGMNPRS